MSNTENEKIVASNEKDAKIELTKTEKKTFNVVNKERRRSRIPLSEQKALGIKTDPNYVYRLVNDVPDRGGGKRIENFKRAGWEIVTDEALPEHRRVQNPSQMGSAASQSVGGGIQAFYMRIPKEFYEEDQARLQKENDALMQGIELRNVKHLNPHNTVGGVKITRDKAVEIKKSDKVL